MKKKDIEYGIIGLGTFGSNLAKNLSRAGKEVLAIDQDENKVDAYIDLSGLGVGEHEVEVKINNTNPLVSYVVSSKIKIKITQK